MHAKVILFLLIFASEGIAYADPSATGDHGAAAAPSNPAQQCITDICGPPARSNLHKTKYLDRSNEYFQKLGSDAKQVDFPPAISQIVSEIQAENRKQDEMALDVFKKSTSLGNAKPEGWSKAIYNSLYASEYLDKIKYKATNTDGRIEVSIDEPASLSALADISEEDRSWILRLGKHLLAMYSSGSLSDSEVDSQPATLLLKRLYPASSISEAMKAEISAAQVSVASLKGLSPMESALYFDKTSPDRIALIGTRIADGTVDENEMREIIRWNIDFKRNVSFLRDSKSPLMSREVPSVEEIINQAGGADSLARSFEKELLKDRGEDDGKMNSCEIAFFLNKGLLPSKEQVDTLNKDIARSKQMVIDTIKAKFPSSMHQQLIKSVTDANFIVPPTAADFERNFTSSLRQKLEIQRNNTSVIANIPARDIRQLVAVIYGSNKTQDSAGSKDDSNEFCDAFKYSPMTDANHTVSGSIILSFTTATGEEGNRLLVIMHELGHSVYKAIYDSPKNSAQLFSMRKCLADQHTETMPAQTESDFHEARKANEKADGPYVNEDFSDTLAGLPGKDVKGRNSWCQMLNLSSDRQQYQESSMQSNDGDSHSSSLFRLLNYEMMKNGRVPDSCTNYYKVVQFSEHFSSCFDLASPHNSSSQSQPDRAVR